MSERIQAVIIGGTNHGTVAMVDKGQEAHRFTRAGTMANFVDPLSTGKAMPQEIYLLRRAERYEGGYVLLPIEDPDLVAAYERTRGQLNNPEAEALSAEMERRGLNT